jgi:arsenate reductase (glutaredoxin)
MPLKVYAYKGCGTCKKAQKWLEARSVAYKEIPIRETPPSKAELNKMLAAYDGNLRRLFNTSGGDYKQLNLKDRVPTMSNDEAFDLLASNGNLVKRPFVIGDGLALVGFKEDEWESALG